jgi:hypothetical protein
VCFYKSVKGSSTKSLKKAIEDLFKRWGVSDKDVKAKDIKAVLRHWDKISYNNIIIKARGLVKG